jgi:hypothetical protein
MCLTDGSMELKPRSRSEFRPTGSVSTRNIVEYGDFVKASRREEMAVLPSSFWRNDDAGIMKRRGTAGLTPSGFMISPPLGAHEELLDVGQIPGALATGLYDAAPAGGS